MNVNPFIDLFVTVINLYTWMLIIWFTMSWLIYFRVINTYQPFIKKLSHILHSFTEPLLIRIRKFVPIINGIDLSPIVLFLLLGLLKNILYTYFYH